MRVTCACSPKNASPDLIAKIGRLGITPIVTDSVIRAVWEGERSVGERLVKLFKEERKADIVAFYDKAEKEADERKAEQKALKKATQQQSKQHKRRKK